MYFVDFLDISTGYYIFFVFLFYKIIWLLIFFQERYTEFIFGKKGGLKNIELKFIEETKLVTISITQKRNIDRGSLVLARQNQTLFEVEELFTGFFSKEPKTCQKGQNGIVQFRHVHNKKTTSHMVGDVSNSISASSLSHIQH